MKSTGKWWKQNRADRVTWMDLETVMLSEVHQRQRQMHDINCILNVKTMAQVNLSTRQKWKTHVWLPGGKGGKLGDGGWRITLPLCCVTSAVSDCVTYRLQPIRLLYPWNFLGARILGWAAMPATRGSSQPRDRTQVSRIAGGFFTSWATREAPYTH